MKDNITNDRLAAARDRFSVVSSPARDRSALPPSRKQGSAPRPAPARPRVVEDTESRPVLICSLNEEETALTARNSRALLQVNNPHEFAAAAASYTQGLAFLADVLLPFRRGVFSAVHLQGLPTDAVLPAGRDKGGLNSEMNLYGIRRAAGLREPAGEKVRDTPPPAALPDPGARPVDSLVPGAGQAPFTALFCLRNERATPLRVAEIDEVIASLPAHTLEILAAPRFATADPSGGAWGRSSPVLFESGGRQHLALATRHVKPLDNGAARALRQVDEVLDSGKAGREVLLRPGDALVLANDRVLHGKTTLARAERLWFQTLLLDHRDKALANRKYPPAPAVL